MNRTISAVVVGCILGTVGYLLKHLDAVIPELYNLFHNKQAIVCILVCALVGGLIELWYEDKEEVKALSVVGVKSSADAMTYYVFPKKKDSRKTAKPFMVITTPKRRESRGEQ